MNLPASHLLIAAGASGIAVTTAAEVLTASYSAHVVLYEINPAMHVIKVLAALVFVVGMLALAARHHKVLGRSGSAAAVALATGTAAGAIPYSLVEATMSPRTSPAEAAAYLDRAYEAELAWVGYLASAAMLLLFLGLVTLAVVGLRQRLLPRWRLLVGLAAIPLSVIAAVLGETTGLPVPHPPAWLFACLALAYATPLRSTPTTQAVDSPGLAAASPNASGTAAS